MLKTTPSSSVDEDNTTVGDAYLFDMGQDTRLRRGRSGHAILQVAQLAALYAGVTALEMEAIQEGRLILLEAAVAAGLDIQALAWQAIRLA